MALVDTRMILNAGLRIFEREVQFVIGTSSHAARGAGSS
jgi:hypothetical protein